MQQRAVQVRWVCGERFVSYPRSPLLFRGLVRLIQVLLYDCRGVGLDAFASRRAAQCPDSTSVAAQ